MDHPFTADERRLIELWERHMSCEFAERDAAATVATMSGDNYVNHVPIMTGGRSGSPGVLRAALHPQDAGRHGDRPGLPDRRPGAGDRRDHLQVHA